MFYSRSPWLSSLSRYPGIKEILVKKKKGHRGQYRYGCDLNGNRKKWKMHKFIKGVGNLLLSFLFSGTGEGEWGGGSGGTWYLSQETHF